MGKFALINGRLIDGTDKEPRDGWGLVVDGTNIHSVEAVGSLRVPADAEVIDVEGRTLMPGLIDAHTHLTYTTEKRRRRRLRDIFMTLETNTIKAIENAQNHPRYPAAPPLEMGALEGTSVQPSATP